MAFQWYLNGLKNNPIVFRSVSFGGVLSIGDVLAQLFESKVMGREHKYDINRTLRQGCVGTFIVGPTITVWWMILEKWFPGQTTKQAMKKLLTDQFTFGPVILGINMGSTLLLKGHSLEETKERLKHQFPTTLLNSLAIWPITNFSLFRFVQPDHRVVISSFVSTIWNGYLSILAHSNIDHTHAHAHTHTQIQTTTPTTTDQK